MNDEFTRDNQDVTLGNSQPETTESTTSSSMDYSAPTPDFSNDKQENQTSFSYGQPENQSQTGFNYGQPENQSQTGFNYGQPENQSQTGFNYGQTASQQPYGYAQTNNQYSNPQYANQQYANQQYTPYGSYGQQEAANKKKDSIGFGVASLILGISSLLLFCCCVNFITGLIGIILGIVQIATCQKKGLAIGGIITSALSIILGIVFWVASMDAGSEYDPYDYDSFEEYYNDIYNDVYEDMYGDSYDDYYFDEYELNYDYEIEGL